MTSALDATHRSRLERLVVAARRLLENDLADQAEGRFGLHLDGRIEHERSLHLDPTAAVQRRELCDIVVHLRALGEDEAGAVARLIREAAFSHLNRLVAIRVAESAGLLPESLRRGEQSSGFRELADLAPLVADDYWGYLRLCSDELAADAPALFDPRNPLLALAPTPACINKLGALFADPATGEIWGATDTLGWAYQFFNTGDERRAMREASSAPRNSRELAVRNQFFTPRYVVDFLVHNTLGRRIVESDPTTPLLGQLPLLLDPPTEPVQPLDLSGTKVLDPACGSGHFLLGCYDLLEAAWSVKGVSPAAAAPRIVAALWGVDIDPRCAQIASAAIMLRARRHCRDLTLLRPNIVTARAMPDGALLPNTFAQDPDVRRLVDVMAETLGKAPLLGALLKIEQHMEQELRGMLFGNRPGTLEITDHAYGEAESRVIRALRVLADSTTATVADRLFAAEAEDAIRFLEVCRTRFDAVLMNPPFGEPVPETKEYLRAAYPWLPTKDSNLLAAFVGRGLELCKPDGYLGAITSRTGMFLSTFTNWRTDVLLANRVTVLADFGFGVMEQALVEAAAYVVGPGHPDPSHQATFVRLLKDHDRAAGLTAAVSSNRAGRPDTRLFRVALGDLISVPRSPMAYWLSPSIRRLFAELPPMEGRGVVVRVGLQTGDDFRFVRAFWEIDPRRIARSRDETHRGGRWCPFAKGGEYSPYWADVHLVVDYGEDGRRLRKFEGSVIRNPSYYFRAGLTWPGHTTSGFGPRVLPAGCVFSHMGPSLFAGPGEELGHLGWLMTRVLRACIDVSLAAGDEVTSGGAKRKYEVGIVQRVPAPPAAAHDTEVVTLVKEIVRLATATDDTDETTRRFTRPSSKPDGIRQSAVDLHRSFLESAVRRVHLSYEIERKMSEPLGLDGDVEEYLRSELGSHPWAYPSEPADIGLIKQLYALPIDALVDQAVERMGGSRVLSHKVHIADRRLEVLSHLLQRRPDALAAQILASNILPPEQPHALAEDLISYLVGCSFGRWDVRIGVDPTLSPAPPDILDPVPLCPPGMLVDRQGLPATETPTGYPLDLPPGRVLVDEPGHMWDVEQAVLRVASVLFENPGAIVAELLQIVGRKSLRDYLRRDFFKAHLSRYSRSRRKAPIYWPITVKKSGWGVWVYAPMLSRETLYRVAHEARRRERLAAEAITRLHDEKARGGAGRPVRKVAEELDAEVRLAEELRGFRAEAERVADLGWEPDLDDGIVLNAAPLADLLPAWPEAAKERKQIRAGAYPWATVSQWKDRL